MADENEDDFVVLTRNSETRSDGDDQFEHFSNLSLASPIIDEFHATQNPIADVVKRLSHDDDEAWISRSVVTDEVSEFHQRETEATLGALTTGRLFGNFMIPTSSASAGDWLATDNGVLKHVASRSSLKSEESTLGLRKSCSGLSQWLSASSSCADGTCTGDRREQELFSFSHEGSKFNPLSHVFSASFNRKFGLPSTTKRGASRRRSFKKEGFEKRRLARPTSEEQESPREVGFFAKVLANIDSKPTNFWLFSDEVKKPESDCLPLNYWLSPSSSAAAESSLCRSTEDPRNNDITSSDCSKADSFSSFARRVLSSASSEWLLAKPSIDLQPFKFTSSKSALTSSPMPAPKPVSGWCSFKFKFSQVA